MLEQNDTGLVPIALLGVEVSLQPRTVGGHEDVPRPWWRRRRARWGPPGPRQHTSEWCRSIDECVQWRHDRVPSPFLARCDLGDYERMISAARSAIAKTVALVFAETGMGITEASATRRLLVPCT